MPTYEASAGAKREVTQLPAGHDGAVRQLDGAYAGHAGAGKMIFGRYRWEKWDVKEDTVYFIVEKELVDNVSKYGTDSVNFYTEVSLIENVIMPAGEEITMTAMQSYNTKIYETYPYLFARDSGKRYVIKVDRASRVNSNSGVRYYGDQLTVSSRIENVKGNNLLGIVQSDNPSAYPENGVQDGYWYVRVT